MRFDGTLTIAAPDLQNAKDFIVTDSVGVSTVKAKKESVPDFAVWIDASKDDVLRIQTNLRDRNAIMDTLTLEIDGNKGGVLELSLSVSQCVVLAEILARYSEAYHATRALETVRKVQRV